LYPFQGEIKSVSIYEGVLKAGLTKPAKDTP